MKNWAENVQWNPSEIAYPSTEIEIQQVVLKAANSNKKIRTIGTGHSFIEIDVGLHLGGFMTLNALRNALSIMTLNSKYIEFSGLMGYDPHVVKLPSIIRLKEKALQLANIFYQNVKILLKKNFLLYSQIH